MTNPQDEDTVWPSSATDLIDTHLCPACFTPITEMTCRQCGLVLGDPRAARLVELGRRAVDIDHERRAVIAEIRRAHAAAPAAPVAPPAAPVRAMPAPATPAPATPAPAIPAVATPVPVNAWGELPPPHIDDLRPAVAPGATAEPVVAIEPPAAPPRRPRRRLSVPVLLLIVGVSLVGVAAVFFLLLAWFVAGIAVRALIIAGVTAATIATASFLRRRELTATAEGIAVLGVILLALDAWAVRANDLFGAGATRPAVYAGVAALVVGVLLRVWARLSRLRAPDLVAVLALPTGLGLLVGGLSGLESNAAIVAGLLGASVGGMAHTLPPPWSAARARADAVPERVTLAVVGVISLVGAAAVAAVSSPDSIVLPLWSTVAIVGLSATHAFLLRARTDAPAAADGMLSDADADDLAAKVETEASPEGGASDAAPVDGADELPWRGVLLAAVTTLGAVVAGMLGWQVAVRGELDLQTFFLGPVIAVAVAALIDRLRGRERPRRELRVASIGATLIGGTSLVIGVIMWAARASHDLIVAWTPWQTPTFARSPLLTTGVDAALWSGLGAVAVAALLLVAPTLRRPGWRDARVVVAVALLLGAGVLSAIPAVVVGVGAAVATVAVAAVARHAQAARGWWIAAFLSATVAYLAGTTAPALWLVGVGVALAVPICLHVVAAARGALAVRLTVSAVMVAAISAFVAPAAMAAASGSVVSATEVPFILLSWIALAALVLAAAAAPDRSTRSALTVSALTLIVVSFARLVAPLLPLSPDDAGPGLLGEPVAGIIRSAALVALLTIVAVGRTPITGAAARAGALLVAPLVGTGVFAVLDAAGLAADSAPAIVGSAAATTWAAAIVGTRATPTPERRRVRALVDGGALATAAAVAMSAASDRWWAVSVIAAAGFAGASVCRGWAAPQAASLPGVFSTTAPGATVSAAPRRLLIWPSIGFATIGLWLWLAPFAANLAGDAPTIEAYALPPSIGLIVLAVLMTWLRRRAEATVAAVLGVTIGLAMPALASWSGSDVRGGVVAAVATTLTLVVSWTPLRRTRGTAVATATSALVVSALVALERTIVGAALQGWWAAGFVLLAYAAAFGFIAGRRGRADASPEAAFALVVPPLAVGLATMSLIGQARHPLVLTISIGLALTLHLAAAARDRRPLGTITRWTAFGAALVLAGVGFGVGTVTTVEAVTIPLALAVMAGAALVLWRRPGTASERAVWLGGLGLALLPSTTSAVEPVRVWLVIVGALLAAVGCAVAPASRTFRLASPSAMILTAGSLLMGARALFASDADALPWGDAAALVAGAGAVLVAAVSVWMTDDDRPPIASTVLAGAGAALLVATTVVQAARASGSADDDLPRTAITVLVAAVAGVAGAALLRLPRWRGLAAVTALGGLLGATIAAGLRFVAVADLAPVGIEPDLWALAGAGVVAAIGVAAIRSTRDHRVDLAAGAVFAVTVVLWALAGTLLLGADPLVDGIRAFVLTSALTAAGAFGVMPRDRLGIALPVASAVALVLFAVSALALHGVDPIEAVTAPPALGLIVLGIRRLRSDATARTWPTLGPGLALLTLPSLALDVGPGELWRVVALGVVAIAMVLTGALGRLQAPLVLGSAVLLVHAGAQLWPWISQSYVAVPWWLWLGIGGAVLIVVAARYEKQMRAIRSAFTAVVSLR
ncbi:SCO7613 C-terminal domain-containing membrane protein [Microbacterium sp. P01]|uniref:SCO7613 C-terminal domain-containing membrane protein n=1 Tax=Microbacterium sp. P01 TaxID=3366261 RepID=UPI00366FDE6F